MIKSNHIHKSDCAASFRRSYLPCFSNGLCYFFRLESNLAFSDIAFSRLHKNKGIFSGSANCWWSNANPFFGWLKHWLFVPALLFIASYEFKRYRIDFKELNNLAYTNLLSAF